MYARQSLADAVSRRGPIVATVLGAALLLPAGAGHAGGPIPPQPPMTEPLLELTPEELDRFLKGRDRFIEFTPLPSDGLGPVFNLRNCSTCHSSPAGGSGVQTVTRFGREVEGLFDPMTEYGGSLLQALANEPECMEEIPAEATIIAQRVVNGAFGYGLIEAIPDDDILALEQDPPGISGRAHIVEAIEEPGVPRVGRFGWKAQLPTIRSFSADAALNEMGITSDLLPDEIDPNGIFPPHLEDCDEIPDPEALPDEEGFTFVDRVTDFQRFLARPPQAPRSGMTGEAMFVSVGCGDCHHPAFTTADDAALESALRQRPLRPYSDFLLHEMGDAADRIGQGDASGLEMRTPPLWGLRERRALWHDGRFGEDLEFFDRVAAAIEEHGADGSEAAEAGVIDSWTARAPDEKASVLQFLGSLGRREFDWHVDRVVILEDFVAFAACFTGPGKFYTPDDECSISDIDQDGDVDADDYASFLLAYGGSREDCNDNGVLDLDDIIFGTSEDADADGIPDECNCSRADLDGDGSVGAGDLLRVLARWGPCHDPEGCPEDIDGSGVIDSADLLFVLAQWGPCA